LNKKTIPMNTSIAHFTQTTTSLFWGKTGLFHHTAPVAFAQNSELERIMLHIEGVALCKKF